MADRPTHNIRARTGRQDGEGKDILMTVGAAWQHQNGNGFNLQVNTLPVGFDGYLMVIERRDE